VTLARIHHPNIVTVYDIVDDGSAAFIAMELVEGVSLEDYLGSEERLPQQQVVALGILVLRAIAAAHENGIVHHDIKPANILLGEDDAVKVTDFGIAEVLSKASKGGSVVCGTPGYLPPETLLGKGYDAQSDLFAVGVVLYQCLLGHRPFGGRSAKEIMVETLVASPPPIRQLRPEVTVSLEGIILRLLAAEPAKRPENAKQAENLLQQIAGDGLHWRPKPFKKRRRDGNDKEMVRPHTSMLPTYQLGQQ
jgi:serine/threonine-protein kinase